MMEILLQILSHRSVENDKGYKHTKNLEKASEC